MIVGPHVALKSPSLCIAISHMNNRPVGFRIWTKNESDGQYKMNVVSKPVNSHFINTSGFRIVNRYSVRERWYTTCTFRVNFFVLFLCDFVGQEKTLHGRMLTLKMYFMTQGHKPMKNPHVWVWDGLCL